MVKQTTVGKTAQYAIAPALSTPMLNRAGGKTSTSSHPEIITVVNCTRDTRYTSSSFRILDTVMICMAMKTAQTVESRSPRLKPPEPPCASCQIPPMARMIPARPPEPTLCRQRRKHIRGMKSTNRLFRNPALVAEVPESPTTKVKFVAARARPTKNPRFAVSKVNLRKRGMQTQVMMTVATVNLMAKKATGGTSRKPILLKTKLPPQKIVVRTRNE